MSQDRLIVAIGRIERAISRIEQQPSLPIAASSAICPVKHQGLKTAAQAALAEMDAFINEHSR
jgi:hypothetical protein